MPQPKPSLFGLKYSNRDFTQKEAWGKNQFNSSFPASLCSYIHSQGLKNIYLKLDHNLRVIHSFIDTEEFYGIVPNSDNLFYAFETQFTPYQQFLIGNLPRVDLVTQMRDTGTCLQAIEIKLTALPDHRTCDFDESQYGCEIVVRPDTIVYLACSTEGKSPKLSENCLDVFVWSNLAFTRLFLNLTKTEEAIKTISRHTRTLIWLFKMIYDFSLYGQINARKILDELSYNTKNDQAFAVSGRTTHPYLKSSVLVKPRIEKTQIRKIILGGGQNLLSPERRFDAIIYNSSDLFD